MSSPSSPLPTSYRAYRYSQQGDALEQLSLDAGVALAPLAGPTFVRVRVRSAALNPADYKIVTIAERFFTAHPMPAPYPIGFDFAGEVVEVGADVRRFAVGDAVYGMASPDGFGSFAEFLSVDEQFVAPKPAGLSFDEAAGVPLVSLTSYQALADYGRVGAGSRVLILGGSSGTGIAAVQIAKALGAHVTATTSARNAEFVKSLGADEVIDYTSQQWGDVVAPQSLDAIYDCGFDAESWNGAAQTALKPGAHFVTIGGTAAPIASPIGATYHQILTKASGADLEKVSALIARGQLAPHVDSVFAFEELLDAIRRLKTNRARGKVVLRVAPAQEQK